MFRGHPSTVMCYINKVLSCLQITITSHVEKALVFQTLKTVTILTVLRGTVFCWQNTRLPSSTVNMNRQVGWSCGRPERGQPHDSSFGLKPECFMHRWGGDIGFHPKKSDSTFYSPSRMFFSWYKRLSTLVKFQVQASEGAVHRAIEGTGFQCPPCTIHVKTPFSRIPWNRYHCGPHLCCMVILSISM